MSTRTALVPIDVQRAFDHPRWGPRNQPQAEQRIARLLAAWRDAGLPIFHVRHSSRHRESPLHASHPGFAFKPEAAPLPGEPVITKDVNSAFIGTHLEARLREAGIERVILFGFTTQHCVSTTTRMAANLGFEAIVVSDATVAFEAPGSHGPIAAETVHEVSLATLRDEFATILTADQAIELTRVAASAA